MNRSHFYLALMLSSLSVGVLAQKPNDPTTQRPNDPAAQRPTPNTSALTMQLSKQVPGEFLYRFLNAKGTSSAPTALPTPTGKDSLIPLSVPAEYKGGTLEVQDTTRGDAARLPIKTDAPVTLNEGSFNIVQNVKVPVTAGGKPAVGVLIEMKSKDGKFSQTRTLQTGDGGTARFENVPLGQPITVTLKYGANPEKSQTETLTRNHPPDGYSWQTQELNWKDVPTSAAAVPANPMTTTQPVAGTAAGSGVPQTLPNVPTPAASSGGGLGGILNTIISLALLAGIAYGLYWAYQKGKIKELLEKLGIQTAALTPDAGAVAANPFTKQTTPITPISEGTADPFAGGVGMAGTVPAAAPVSNQPRLVATMGTYSGQIFPLSGTSADIGRDAANAVALPNDTNASRRHATLQVGNGSATVTDNGSSNGTFVNGVRIAAQTPTPLKPNDELTVGNTRFRFEI